MIDCVIEFSETYFHLVDFSVLSEEPVSKADIRKTMLSWKTWG